MLLGAKKTRLCDSVTKFPQIKEHETIELDSLENSDVEDKNASKECFMDEIVLPGDSLQSLSDLKTLSLRSNGIQAFPYSILQLTTLTNLDLSDNALLTIPPEISVLENLNEFVLDQNLLSVLPNTLWKLRFLQILKVAHNRIILPPDMRALILSDISGLQESELKPENANLTNLNLRANRLKGNIILGNYGHLVELDVSENNIENLDLSAIEQLQILQCSRNCLTHLTLYGKNLISVIAGNNKLKTLTTVQAPLGLRHFDVSYNELETLPEWLCGCSELRMIFASNNNLATLPNHLFCNEMPFLSTVQLAYNHLQNLPMIQRKLQIKDLFLQNNSLSSLPDNFFKYISNIRILNLSNNRLCYLPIPEDTLLLEKLYMTANCLIDKSLLKLSPYLKNLKILHGAYNSFTSLPENCATYWPEIEELVVSGNKLLRLPDQIGFLKHLNVLRVHSNLLQNIPKLSNLVSLKVLDLAHNQLDRVDLVSLIPPNLKFLDLSCNNKLHVDSQQFNNYRTQRPMSLVDVSGQNRTSLPLTPSPFCENDQNNACNWTVGFSETAGSKQRLYIAQIRLPAFCNTEALFGMFDGENNNNNPLGVDKIVPRVLLEERTVKETASDYMKYTMLSAHRELRDKTQKQGLNAIICHILKIKSPEYSFCGPYSKYTMKIASVGDIRVVLGRATGPIRLLPTKHKRQIRTNPHQLTVPDPDLSDVHLDEQDEYMIIANRNLWDVISPENAIKEVTLQRNVILAAKRLQDLAQSYGAEENLSIIVVKFNLITNDVDLLMKELRQTFKKNKYQTCQSNCCCETLTSECEKIPQILFNDDRSSPSGQSEHCSDCNSSAKLFINQLNKHNDLRSIRSVTTPSLFESKTSERRSYRGVARALKVRKEEEKNDSDSALSEEQFKCWEYMLEQNTQLLFDKELNTLTRTKKPLQLKNPTLSRSNPQISDNNSVFLSKQFGSTRSFNPVLTRSSSRFALENKKLMGGPHAAYFGSLQRLMPYNLEYDFAVMHERGLADSLDLDRMQQYWGVTTTEL